MEERSYINTREGALQHRVPLLSPRHRLILVKDRLIVRYNVVKELEEGVQLFVLSVVLLAGGFKLRRILLRERYFELLKGVL